MASGVFFRKVNRDGKAAFETIEGGVPGRTIGRSGFARFILNGLGSICEMVSMLPACSTATVASFSKQLTVKSSTSPRMLRLPLSHFPTNPTVSYSGILQLFHLSSALPQEVFNRVDVPWRYRPCVHVEFIAKEHPELVLAVCRFLRGHSQGTIALC